MRVTGKNKRIWLFWIKNRRLIRYVRFVVYGAVAGASYVTGFHYELVLPVACVLIYLEENRAF